MGVCEGENLLILAEAPTLACALIASQGEDIVFDVFASKHQFKKLRDAESVQGNSCALRFSGLLD